VQQDSGAGGTGTEGAAGKADENIRPQKAGEAATTRFGMEEGDNTDIPATGDASRDAQDS
jgi:hypothetical protein